MCYVRYLEILNVFVLGVLFFICKWWEGKRLVKVGCVYMFKLRRLCCRFEMIIIMR